MQTLLRLLTLALFIITLAACGSGESEVTTDQSLSPLEALREPALVPRYDQAFWSETARRDTALIDSAAAYCAESAWGSIQGQLAHPNCRAVSVPINALNNRRASEAEEHHTFSADSFSFE